MLQRLKLTNFRQHQDREFIFTPGLNVVRGLNESGKTTLLEGVAYVLGGLKACRDPLELIVSYGKKPSEVKTELDLLFDGVVYCAKRSKSGAEVNYDGGNVVGQSEVTAFFERLFGCDMKMAGSLMMASQGEIRGALKAGPGATMALIENLADFSVIDRVIDLIQSNLTTGPTTAAEERTATTRATLESVKAVTQVPDTAALEVSVLASESKLASLLVATAKAREPVEAARAAVQAAEVAKRARDGFKGQLEGAVTRQKLHIQQRADALQAAAGAPTTTTLNAAATRIEKLESVERELEVYGAFKALVMPDVVWDEPSKTLDAAIAEAQSAVDRLNAELNTTRGVEGSLVRSKQTGAGACQSCGQKLPNADAVAAHNAKIDAEIVGVRERITLSNVALGSAKADLTGLQGVVATAKPFEAFVAKFGDWVEINDTQVPPLVSWKGDAPAGSAAELPAAEAELAKLQALVKTTAAAAAKAEALEQTVREDADVVMDLGLKIAAITEPEQLVELREQLSAATSVLNSMVGETAMVTYAKQQAEEQIANAKTAYEAAKKAVADAEAAIARADTELTALHFNNNLLKRIRAARPAIADKLWSAVLASVSTYFSAMRGENSVVTREGNEFLVNGKKIGGGGLSGSALDVLGLAIRLALTRTFLPLAPFLTLDEPAAAADDQRAGNMLGFLVGAGFPQTVLVTHEDISESVAQNLITL